jgi:hypothetical protein
VCSGHDVGTTFVEPVPWIETGEELLPRLGIDIRDCGIDRNALSGIHRPNATRTLMSPRFYLVLLDAGFPLDAGLVHSLELYTLFFSLADSR